MSTMLVGSVIQRKIDKEICVLTFDRPESGANVFDTATLQQLDEHLDFIRREVVAWRHYCLGQEIDLYRWRGFEDFAASGANRRVARVHCRGSTQVEGLFVVTEEFADGNMGAVLATAGDGGEQISIIMTPPTWSRHRAWITAIFSS
jgi:hypothetical protein